MNVSLNQYITVDTFCNHVKLSVIETLCHILLVFCKLDVKMAVAMMFVCFGFELVFVSLGVFSQDFADSVCCGLSFAASSVQVDFEMY